MSSMTSRRRATRPDDLTSLVFVGVDDLGVCVLAAVRESGAPRPGRRRALERRAAHGRGVTRAVVGKLSPDPLELQSERQSAPRAPTRLRFGRRDDQSIERPRHRGGPSAGRGRLAPSMTAFIERRELEDSGTCDRVVEQHTEAVDVRAPIHALSSSSFRCHRDAACRQRDGWVTLGRRDRGVHDLRDARLLEDDRACTERRADEPHPLARRSGGLVDDMKATRDLRPERDEITQPHAHVCRRKARQDIGQRGAPTQLVYRVMASAMSPDTVGPHDERALHPRGQPGGPRHPRFDSHSFDSTTPMLHASNFEEPASTTCVAGLR